MPAPPMTYPIVRREPASVVPPGATSRLPVVGGQKAIRSVGDIFKGQGDPKGIAVAIAGFLLISAVLFIDWRKLLQRKRLSFDFHIFR